MLFSSIGSCRAVSRSMSSMGEVTGTKSLIFSGNLNISMISFSKVLKLGCFCIDCFWITGFSSVGLVDPSGVPGAVNLLSGKISG